MGLIIFRGEKKNQYCRVLQSHTGSCKGNKRLDAGKIQMRTSKWSQSAQTAPSWGAVTPPAPGVLESSLAASNFGPVISLQERHFYAQVFKMKAREERVPLCTPNTCIINVYCIVYIQYYIYILYRKENKKIAHPCASFRRNCSEI